MREEGRATKKPTVEDAPIRLDALNIAEVLLYGAESFGESLTIESIWRLLVSDNTDFQHWTKGVVAEMVLDLLGRKMISQKYEVYEVQQDPEDPELDEDGEPIESFETQSIFSMSPSQKKRFKALSKEMHLTPNPKLQHVVQHHKSIGVCPKCGSKMKQRCENDDYGLDDRDDRTEGQLMFGDAKYWLCPKCGFDTEPEL